jgi:glycosyltransferase involved in cell wall biosynthesis
MDLFSNKKDPFHRWLYRPVDLLVTVTNAMRNQVLAFLPIPPERVHMLYLGAPDVPADTKEDCYRFRAKLGIPDHSFLVGLIGRIEEPKGQHLLIDAILLLRSRGLDIRGILIGNAMNQDYYESLRTSVRSANDPESICFFGFHPHPHAIMHCFDIVVLTTRRETFGLVLIEAMNAGTAVIGSNAGGVKEIIDDEKTGLLFQSGDSASLATALRTLYDDSGYRQRLAAAGKQKAETVFSEKRHYEKLVDLYKAVLDRESDPS